jgi:hypothetical protein
MVVGPHPLPQSHGGWPAEEGLCVRPGGGVGHAPGRPAAGYTSALNRRSEGFPQSPLAFIPR